MSSAQSKAISAMYMAGTKKTSEQGSSTDSDSEFDSTESNREQRQKKHIPNRLQPKVVEKKKKEEAPYHPYDVMGQIGKGDYAPLVRARAQGNDFLTSQYWGFRLMDTAIASGNEHLARRMLDDGYRPHTAKISHLLLRSAIMGGHRELLAKFVDCGVDMCVKTRDVEYRWMPQYGTLFDEMNDYRITLVDILQEYHRSPASKANEYDPYLPIYDRGDFTTIISALQVGNRTIYDVKSWQTIMTKARASYKNLTAQLAAQEEALRLRSFLKHICYLSLKGYHAVRKLGQGPVNKSFEEWRIRRLVQSYLINH
jgi:hypothetical protein